MKKVLLSTAVIALLSGCMDDNSGESSLTLKLTDGPVDSAASVNIQFNGVELRHADEGLITIEFDEPKVIDMLALQGSQSTALVTDEEVPAGEYTWMRLMVDGNSNIVMEDGSQFDLFIPSGEQTGYKISGFTLPVNAQADFTLDFDLRKSITNAAGMGYILRPTVRLVDNTEVGHIAGTVDGTLLTANCDDTTDTAVYVFEGADATLEDEGATDSEGNDLSPVASSLVNDLGEYEVGFLTAGDYTVALTCIASQDVADTDEEVFGKGTGDGFISSDTVTVEVDQTATHDFIQ